MTTETPEQPVPSLYLFASIFFCACLALEALGLYLMLGWARERRQKSGTQGPVVADEPSTAVAPVGEMTDEVMQDALAESR